MPMAQEHHPRSGCLPAPLLPSLVAYWEVRPWPVPLQVASLDDCSWLHSLFASRLHGRMQAHVHIVRKSSPCHHGMGAECRTALLVPRSSDRAHRPSPLPRYSKCHRDYRLRPRLHTLLLQAQRCWLERPWSPCSCGAGKQRAGQRLFSVAVSQKPQLQEGHCHAQSQPSVWTARLRKQARLRHRTAMAWAGWRMLLSA